MAFPAIVGHEIVGKVVRAGSKSGHKLGDRVGFGAQCNSCRKCPNCARGLENYCLFGNVGTYQGKTGDKTQPVTQGGYADFYQGPGHFAIPIPDAIEPEVAAPMLCAGVTVYSPLKNYGAGPGKRVGIVGIGGLGHLALQFSKALGAETWAISHSERKKDDALKLGAVGFIATKDEKSVLKKHLASFDLLLVTSNQDDMPLRKLYLPLLKPYGNCIISLTPVFRRPEAACSARALVPRASVLRKSSRTCSISPSRRMSGPGSRSGQWARQPRPYKTCTRARRGIATSLSMTTVRNSEKRRALTVGEEDNSRSPTAGGRGARSVGGVRGSGVPETRSSEQTCVAHFEMGAPMMLLAH